MVFSPKEWQILEAQYFRCGTKDSRLDDTTVASKSLQDSESRVSPSAIKPRP